MWGGALPQLLPFSVSPQPRPVMSLTAEALSLRGKVFGLIGWDAALMDVDGHSLLKGFDVREKRGLSFYCVSHGLAP